LFENEGQNVFAVLDGASVPDLLDALYDHQPEQACLYRGPLEPDLAEVAPYLVRLERHTDFTGWLLEQGWGNHWGIFAFSEENLPDLLIHLRKFLIVYSPDGQPLNFRYYDPRVLRIYLPTCNTEELALLFGPVTGYLLEDADPATARRFRLESGSLLQERLTLAGLQTEIADQLGKNLC
jgi:hypothetical protein